MKKNHYKYFVVIFLFIFFFSFLSIALAADYYDWSTRTDRDGHPAGIFTTTPFPLDESSTTYSITNDEGTKTFTLGTIYFVDNGASGCTNGNTSYNPTNRNCTGGSNTVYTTIANALSAVTPGNKTIFVRDGTYGENNLTYKPGTDDTHRYMICGYKQERPVIDGGNSVNAIFSNTSNANAYFTLQRVKLQNNKYTCVRLGTKTTAKRDAYFSLIDVEIYNCANDTVNFGADGNVYYLNADYPFVYHITSYHSMGHCLKIGDNAQGAVVEWSKVYECGYWSTMMTDQGITDWRQAPTGNGPGTHPSGLDFPNDTGENAQNYKVRYNIVYDTLFYGSQLRNTSNFSFHHNEIYKTPHFDDVPGATTGASNSPQLLILGQGSSAGDSSSGNCYSNVIYDAADANSCGISINSIKNGYTVNIYNNIIYNNPLAEIGLYGYLATPGSTRALNVWNNSLYHNSGTTAVIEGSANWAAGEVTIKNNILYQAGAGKTINLDTDIVLDYNQYFYPSGFLGTGSTGNNDLGKTGTGSNPLWVANPSGTYQSSFCKFKVRSPVINAGTDLSAFFTTDFNLNSRPYGAIWYIGAYHILFPSPPSNLR